MIVCTLGMHRSGTSLVSRMLNLLGVHLGPERSVRHASDDNPKGYWEHQPLARLNDDVLARFGGTWQDPPAFPVAWTRDPRIADLRERARQVLAADFGTQPIAGWKDPRTCVTLPLWQELWRELARPMRYVLCVRNPCAVVASLSRRSDMKPEWGERLWLTYVQASLIYTSGQPRMFLFYEDIVQNWLTELRRMAAFIGRPEQAEDPAVQAGVAEFFEQEMCHYRMTLEDLAVDPRISFPSKSLFVALRGHAPRAVPTPDDAGLGDHATRSLQRSLDMLANWSLQTWHQTAGIAAQRETLAEENRRLTVALGETETALREAEMGLQQIETSGAWQLVAAGRRALGTVLPPGSRRREAFNGMLRRLLRGRTKTRQQALVEPRPAESES